MGCDTDYIDCDNKELTWQSLVRKLLVVADSGSPSLRVSGLSSYHPDAIAYFAELPDPITDERKSIINDFILSLHTSGNFEKLDRLWLFANTTTDNSVISLVNPAVGDALKVNAPVFTADEGFASGGSTAAPNSYIDANVAMNALTHYTLNSAAIGVYARLNYSAIVSRAEYGCTSNAGYNPNLSLNVRYPAEIFYSTINDANLAISGVAQITKGLHSSVRTNASTSKYYKNGVEVLSGVAASSSLATSNVHIHGYNYNGVHSDTLAEVQQFAVAYLGSGTLDISALYTSIQNYMTALGTQV